VSDTPIARSPIAQAPPVVLVAGWEVSARRSSSLLRLIDCSLCEKILVRGSHESPWAKALDIQPGRSRHGPSGQLIAAIAPEQWLFLGDPGTRLSIADPAAADGGSVGPPLTPVSVTHANALMRLSGSDSARVLSKLCGINFTDTATSNGSALRTSIARVVVSLIRDDLAVAVGARHDDSIRSYFVMCERSAGQYLFNVLLDAGQEFGIDVQGFASGGASLTSVPP